MEINEYLIKFFSVVRDMENMDFFAGVARLFGEGHIRTVYRLRTGQHFELKAAQAFFILRL